MDKAFMKLTDEELKFLEHQIKIFDVQIGCPVQCITCGVCAPKYSGSMSWNDLTTISDSIVETRIRRNINILAESGPFAAFYSSEPLFYHSKDGDKEVSAYDVINKFSKDFERRLVLTTSGWTPGNNYMQKAIEQLIADENETGKLVSFMYSLKTVSKNTIREYEKILKMYSGKDAHAKALEEFINDSAYSRNLQENIKTLSVLKKDSLRISLQYIDDEDMKDKTFSRRFGDYSELFSEKIVERLCNQSMSNLPIETAASIIGSRRKFEGLGKAKDIGIAASEENNFVEKLGYQAKKYSMIITGEGRLQVHYGEAGSYNSIVLSKEKFETLAEEGRRNGNKTAYNNYTIMAKLQGLNLLG